MESLVARQLTAKQQVFLNALFDEAGGSVILAKKIAGYSDTSSTSEIVKGLKEEILEKLAEILEEDSISLTQELESFDEWDSLTTLSLIAMADSDYNISLTIQIVEQFVTVEDVLEYIIKNAQ